MEGTKSLAEVRRQRHRHGPSAWQALLQGQRGSDSLLWSWYLRRTEGFHVVRIPERERNFITWSPNKFAIIVSIFGEGRTIASFSRRRRVTSLTKGILLALLLLDGIGGISSLFVVCWRKNWKRVACLFGRKIIFARLYARWTDLLYKKGICPTLYW